MAKNKIIYGGNTLIDLTSDTVTADKLAEGYTAHDKAGNVITGTMSSGTANLQSKSVTYTSNGSATVTPDSGYDGLSSVDVTVDVSGGGGGSNINFEFGTFTPTSDVITITIPHTLGKIPHVVFVRAKTSPGGSYTRFALSMKKFDDSGFDYSANDSDGYDISLSGTGSKFIAYTKNRYGTGEYNMFDSITDTYFTLGSYNNSSSKAGYKAGVTYYWIAIAE